MNINQLKSNHDLISNEYPDLKVQFNYNERIVWSFMHSGPRPCYTPQLLSNLQSMLDEIKMQCLTEIPVEYLVVGSLVDKVYNLGGDLDLFASYIAENDREKLQEYAYSCIELVYNCTNQIEHDVTSIALVQGSALGGGFEAALACHYIVAEQSAQFGFPEVLFNLFPGMGAFTYLSRRISMRDAEQLIISGKQYSATELYEMGIIDVLVEDGQGMNAVNEFINNHRTQQRARIAMQKAKMRSTLICYDELRDIADIWVDAALKTKSSDIEFMQRLVKIQNRKFTKKTNVHKFSK
ncbi:MAG: crotonase/enoyl-CoA hydratase family protein [Gammaproteobacteria bacterium]|nr:crotonase/enoyl-CoA hydratase family protein [Gammaproteobacteria bacterium]